MSAVGVVVTDQSAARGDRLSLQKPVSSEPLALLANVLVFAAIDCWIGLSFLNLQNLKLWWPGTELNRRRQPFQGCALPAELPGHARAIAESGAGM